MHLPKGFQDKIGRVDMPSLSFEQIKDIYYVVNVMSFVFAFFSFTACVYIKYSLRNRLVFTAIQYKKFLLALVMVNALTALVMVFSLHKMIFYAWFDLTKWLEIILLVFQMMSNDPFFAVVQMILIVLLIGGVISLITISWRVNQQVEHFERLQSKLTASIQMQ